MNQVAAQNLEPWSMLKLMVGLHFWNSTSSNLFLPETLSLTMDFLA